MQQHSKRTWIWEYQLCGGTSMRNKQLSTLLLLNIHYFSIGNVQTGPTCPVATAMVRCKYYCKLCYRTFKATVDMYSYTVHVWMHPCTQQSASVSTLCMSNILHLILQTQLNHNILQAQPNLLFINISYGAH